MQNQPGQGVDKDKEKQAAPVKPDEKSKDKSCGTDKDDKSGGCGSCS